MEYTDLDAYMDAEQEYNEQVHILPCLMCLKPIKVKQYDIDNLYENDYQYCDYYCWYQGQGVVNS